MTGLFLSGAAVLGTIALGVFMRAVGFRGSRKTFICILALSCVVLLTGAGLATFPSRAVAAGEAGTAMTAAIAPEQASSNGMGFIGMALATGLACIGAGIAVGSVGSAAIGLVGEQPGAIGTTLIYVGLAEGVAIYGIVISMLIFSKLAA